MKENMLIGNEFLKDFSKEYRKNPQNKVISNAVIKNGIDNAALNNDSIVNMQYNFSEELETGEITNQKKSGRCWLFAGLNTIRYKISKKLNLKNEDFQLSQSYLMFYDKLEKANYFLENIIDTINEPLDSRTVMWLLQAPMQDGGQWDMFVSLVEKYGVVPREVMPESFHSSNSMRMNKILTCKLREDASVLRKLNKKGKKLDSLKKAKKEMLVEIYNLLSNFLGEPPKTFNFEYRDKDNDFHRDSFISPIEFYKKYIDESIDDYISIINAPTKDKTFNKTYTVKFLGNVLGGKEIKYLNLEIDTLKELAINQIKDGEPVWFGCDVGKMSNRDLGIMDTSLYNYGEILNIKFNFSKGDRLNYGESCLTHAMVLTGVNLIDNKPTRWKVENSWGKEAGNKGFFVMSDEWFNEYTYEIAINKKYLPEKILNMYKTEPIELNPWDPMGSLARIK